LDWEEQFPDSLQSRLPRPLSYHFPVKLESAKLEKGKVPFKFENMWLRAERFSDLIKKWWEEEEVHGFANYEVARKLKVVKVELKKWNKDVFGDVKVRKYNLLNSVNALDKKEKSVGLLWRLNRGGADREELGRILQMEEISWRQKSRALWLREGDRNTKFFHRTANLHRKFNFMSAVVVDGTRLETADNMKSSAHGFYNELFTETES